MRLLRLVPLLFTRFRKEAHMAWCMLTHRETPLGSKLAVLLAGAYLISPIDIVPDFIPVLGLMDDAGIVGLLFTLAYKLMPKALYEALRARVDGGRAATSPAPDANPARVRREPQTIDVTPEK